MLGFSALAETPIAALPVVGGGGGTAYTLSCSSGSYNYVGKDSLLTSNKRLTTSAGSYVVSGKPSAFNYYRVLSASAGSYTYSGKPAGLVRATVLPVASGTYSYVGGPSTLVFNRFLRADSGAYSYTGNSAGVTQGRQLSGDAGAYSYSGNSVTFNRHTSLQMQCAHGAYVVSGRASRASLGFDMLIQTDTAAIAAAVVAALQASVPPIPTNIKQVNDIPVTGTGQTETPWGPV